MIATQPTGYPRNEQVWQKRCRFSHALGLLLMYAKQQGMDVAVDQVKRMQSEADANASSGAGISNSLHLLGLAADLLVYVGGLYLREGSQYAKLGTFWKSLGDDHRWGGDSRDKNGNPKPDLGHISIEHNGVK